MLVALRTRKRRKSASDLQTCGVSQHQSASPGQSRGPVSARREESGWPPPAQIRSWDQQWACWSWQRIAANTTSRRRYPARQHARKMALSRTSLWRMLNLRPRYDEGSLQVCASKQVRLRFADIEGESPWATRAGVILSLSYPD